MPHSYLPLPTAHCPLPTAQSSCADPLPPSALHRLSDAEAAVVQGAGIPRQVLSGKYDPIAGQRYAQWLADHLDCPLHAMGAPPTAPPAHVQQCKSRNRYSRCQESYSRITSRIWRGISE